ncbi:MAG: PIN domain-containing protein [Gammaproteobacteria bacterium]|nr:PIN domain-containing protein [Gammaproteobacteria bacterium]MYK45746.1 PIN domain-containing protein [Gammaproteobacteria bacterium]MYK47688.1 PIN domain-containing protein [Gammaproteobacteria bacterium]
MTAPVFVDTNVLVYRHDSTDPAKQSRADEWLSTLVHERAARVSYQVLQELFVTLTRKVQPPTADPEAREIVRDLASWQPIAIDLAIMERAWVNQQRYLLSWWDALIVAAAQSSGCIALLTEDLQHGQALGDVRVVNPFATPNSTAQAILAGLRS